MFFTVPKFGGKCTKNSHTSNAAGATSPERHHQLLQGILMKKRLVPVLVLACTTAPLFAQTAWHAPTAEASSEASLTAAERTEVVMALAERLETTFYSPAIAKAYAAALRSKLQAGGYNAITSRKALAETITADLQAVNKDGHLGLRASAPGTAPNGQRRQEIQAIPRSGWLADGVAYLEFRIFNGEEAGLAQLKKFLADHSGAKTLIIDVRRHYGGGRDEMDVLLPALFSGPTPLLQGDARAAAVKGMPGALESTPEFALVSAPAGIVRHEHRAIPPAGGGPLSKAKVYLLVSRDTVSAGEHLALALKRTGRATLIGQATRGAGNFGRPYKLPHNFSAFVPSGRTFDPDTGLGWEGTGVRPDLEVTPERALDEALRLTGLQVDGETAASKLQ
jgi:hypothetical protein